MSYCKDKEVFIMCPVEISSEMQSKVEVFKPLIEARSFSYDFLRRAFLIEPSLDYLKLLVQEGFIETFPFREESRDIAKGIHVLKVYVQSHKVLTEEECDTLHWDYTRLFIGPHKLPSPPWESAYLNEERLLFQKETLEVRQAYLKYSFLPVEFGHEADDHVGLELDFMYRLNEIALSKIEKDETNDLQELFTDQMSFLQDHLMKWIPQFSQAIINNANTDFYRGMASLLQGFLTLDLKALEELLDR